MPMTRRDYAAFVPNGESRKDTAILLVGLAEEKGIDQRSIQATSGGFNITDELADLLYDEDDENETPDAATATSTEQNQE